MASGPITSWQIDGETVETLADFILGGSKITADGDCSHEIKRCFLLERKVITNLDSILKSKDITLPTKIHLVKAMVFPVVMNGCEIWTIKKELDMTERLNWTELASVWDECNCVIVWMFFGVAFLWDWNENWPFQSCGHCWVFQICWYIDCSTFTASSFRIWIGSTGIPVPPLALTLVMLLKAHFTSHSRMSGSMWVITPLWLSGSWRSFLYSYSVYSCHLFLISSTSVRSIPFLSFIVPIFAWHYPLVSLIFLKRFLVFHSIVFLYFFVLITKEGILILIAFFSLLVILWNSAFKWVYFSFSTLPFGSLLFSAICKASSGLSWRCSWSLPPVQGHEPPSTVL